MKADNLVIRLTARQDSDKKTFYVGKLRAPVKIDCEEGATFLVFVSEEGEEELQIAVDDSARRKKFSTDNSDGYHSKK